MTKFFSAALVILMIFHAVPASAQATRTWVSGVGDDINPCSRTAPCKTFAGAIGKTAAGGEINCLDPGGFGAVTITKAITISCLHTEGGVLSDTNGIVVNAGPNDAVFLKGLDIFGVSPSTNGIRFIGGGSLHVEDVVIRRFNSTNSYGVSIAASTNSKIYIMRSTIADNGNGASGGGISVQPSGSGRAAVFVIDSTISNNGGRGVFASGTGADVHVVNTRILGNLTGIAAADGAEVTSYGDNLILGNGTDGVFSDKKPKH